MDDVLDYTEMRALAARVECSRSSHSTYRQTGEKRQCLN